MPIPESKTCGRCGVEKVLDDFTKRSSARDGRAGRCKACNAAEVRASYHRHLERSRKLNRERQRRYYADDPAKAREQQRQWREANPEKHLAWSAAWAKANPEKARGYKAKWAAANPDKLADSVRRRRVRLAGVDSEPYTRREIYDRDGGHCKKCGLALGFERYGYEIDHIVPIVLGGADTPANVQLLCRPCNREKAANLDGQLHFAA